MEKRRIITSIEKLPKSLLIDLNHKYPRGYNLEDLTQISIANSRVYVLPFETKDAKYMIKVNNTVNFFNVEEFQEDIDDMDNSEFDDMNDDDFDDRVED